MSAEAENELQDLAEWVELWNRVCATAWGDDDKPAPPWSEVAAKELQGWDLRGMDADQWGNYMRARLVHLTENYLYAVGRHPMHPTPAATSSKA
jgi:hypothetical protein